MRHYAPTIICAAIVVLTGSLLGLTATLFAQSPPIAAGNSDDDNPTPEKLVSRLSSPDPIDRVIAAQQLCDLSRTAKSALPNVVNLLADETQVQTGHGSTQVRFVVMRMLTDLGPRGSDALLAGLSHENRQCRMGAADVLGSLREPRAAPTLVELLGNKDSEVAGHAASALTMIGEPAVQPLLDTLPGKNASARFYAAGALSGMRQSRFVHPIAMLLYDGDQSLRDVAADCLTALVRDSARQTTSDEFDENQENDSSGRLRKSNEAALYKLAIDEVNFALGSENREARLSACKCALSIHAVEFCDALTKCLADQDPVLRTKATEALSAIDQPQILTALLSSLKDPNSEVRVQAATGLSHKCDLVRYHEFSDQLDFLIQPLIDALHDNDPLVRFQSTNALRLVNSRKKFEAVPASSTFSTTTMQKLPAWRCKRSWNYTTVGRSNRSSLCWKTGRSTTGPPLPLVRLKIGGRLSRCERC